MGNTASQINTSVTNAVTNTISNAVLSSSNTCTVAQTSAQLQNYNSSGAISIGNDTQTSTQNINRQGPNFVYCRAMQCVEVDMILHPGRISCRRGAHSYR